MAEHLLLKGGYPTAEQDQPDLKLVMAERW